MNNFASSKLKVTTTLLNSLYYSFKNKLSTIQNSRYDYNKSHSQYGEDRFVIENINVPEKGVFVDVGAGHPTYLSNTYCFEKNGWNGICIDADIKQVELLKTARKNVEWVAIAPEEGEIEFFQSVLSELSTTSHKDNYQGILKSQFKDTVKVPALRLETVLEKYEIGIIDVLNIDVEGVELEVWETFDYHKHQPKVVIMEYYTLGLADNADKIKSFFSDLPYKLAHTTSANFIFVREDIYNL